jgi:hypothetical protein
VTDADRLFRDDRTTMDSLRLVISDAATLGLWWQRATAQAPEPKPPLPSVDFARDMVLLVSAGRRNLGDRILVDSVGFEVRPEPGGRSSEVWFAVVRTTPDCSPFPGSAYPLEFVRIAKVPGTIEFVERVAACPEREANSESKAYPLGSIPPSPNRPGDPERALNGRSNGRIARFLTRQGGERSRQLRWPEPPGR